MWVWDFVEEMETGGEVREVFLKIKKMKTKSAVARRELECANGGISLAWRSEWAYFQLRDLDLGSGLLSGAFTEIVSALVMSHKSREGWIKTFGIWKQVKQMSKLLWGVKLRGLPSNLERRYFTCLMSPGMELKVMGSGWGWDDRDILGNVRLMCRSKVEIHMGATIPGRLHGPSSPLLPRWSKGVGFRLRGTSRSGSQNGGDPSSCSLFCNRGLARSK